MSASWHEQTSRPNHAHYRLVQAIAAVVQRERCHPFVLTAQHESGYGTERTCRCPCHSGTCFEGTAD
jgi:hypothetical protein